jgi:hypothetical protein
VTVDPDSCTINLKIILAGTSTVLRAVTFKIMCTELSKICPHVESASQLEYVRSELDVFIRVSDHILYTSSGKNIIIGNVYNAYMQYLWRREGGANRTSVHRDEIRLMVVFTP